MANHPYRAEHLLAASDLIVRARDLIDAARKRVVSHADGIRIDEVSGMLDTVLAQLTEARAHIEARAVPMPPEGWPPRTWRGMTHTAPREIPPDWRPKPPSWRRYFGYSPPSFRAKGWPRHDVAAAYRDFLNGNNADFVRADMGRANDGEAAAAAERAKA